MPKRIQRKRTKGWRMPAGTVYVGRPTRYGNPFIGPEAVTLYREYAEAGGLRGRCLKELRGKDLACWCPLNQPCHADVLLELANA